MATAAGATVEMQSKNSLSTKMQQLFHSNVIMLLIRVDIYLFVFFSSFVTVRWMEGQFCWPDVPVAFSGES